MFDGNDHHSGDSFDRHHVYLLGAVGMIDEKALKAATLTVFQGMAEELVQEYLDLADLGKSPDPKPDGNRFRVFEIMGYRSKPDLESEFGIEPLKIWYAGTFWPNGAPSLRDLDFRLPDKRFVETAAKNSPKLSVLDIEHWPINSAYYRASVENYLIVLDWFKKSAPGKETGFYSTVPIREYWKVIRGDLDTWKNRNNWAKQLANAVDVLYPSCYTFYEDREGWRKYAVAQIDECRRLAPNKPVYAFLWPEYHVSNAARRGDPIEASYWRMQLETMHEHADGLVIWTMSNTKHVDWFDVPGWWEETSSFMEKIR